MDRNDPAAGRRPGRDRRAAPPARRRTDRIPTSAAAALRGKGTLFVIGGKEDKEGDREILKAVVSRSRGGPVVLATIASSAPDEVWEVYRDVFAELGAGPILRLEVVDRESAFRPKVAGALRDAGAIFFTGGDQVRITNHIGGTPVWDAIQDSFRRGAVIAGTSAGASAMGETMLIAGEDVQPLRIKESLHMAPGLGLMPGAIIDQHFAERARMGRLVGAVAQNPRMLGIGIDENTAIAARKGEFSVLGSGSVYVVDAMRESYTNVAEAGPDDLMAVFDLRLHILSPGHRFDMTLRRPIRPRPEPVHSA
ncbi:MAG TPA: cyanophycinase [Candidatus Polarisedimenticolia bacterium]|nr:cyanophycinase [Candidatus Polarisedimenticolia bacterium]